MGTLAGYLGRALERTITANAKVAFRYKVQRFTTSTAGLEVSLPDARKVGLGGPVYFLWNTGTQTLDLVDFDGNFVAIFGPNELATVLLAEHDDAAGHWVVRVEATDSIPEPPANDYFYTLGGVDTVMQKTPWRYDHAANSWAAQTASAANHIDEGAVASAGIGYIGGSASFQKYAPDIWTNLSAPANSGSHRAAAANVGVGEWYGRSASPGTQHDRYTVATDAWAVGTNFPVASRFAGAEWVETDRIQIFGGTENFTSDAPVQSNRKHVPSTDSFTSMTALPVQAIKRHGHFRLGDNAFAVAGSVTNGDTAFTDRVSSYDPDTDAWTNRTAWPPGTTFHGPGGASRLAATVGYAAGGESSKAARSYQIDTWTTIANHGSSSTGARGIEDSSLALVN